YALRLGNHRYGPVEAALDLAPEWRGDLPPKVPLRVVERRGVDLMPFDLTDPDQRLRLRAYVWHDQPARLARLDRALTLPPAPVDRGDAADWLRARLETPRDGTLHLIYHTIAWQYFPAATQAACRAAIEAAGTSTTASAPLAWLG